MELATPLLPTRAIPAGDNPYASSLAQYLDPLSIPLPPSPDINPILVPPALPRITFSERNEDHEYRGSVNQVENLGKVFHPP